MHLRLAAVTMAAAAVCAVPSTRPTPAQVDPLYTVTAADGILRSVSIVYASTVTTTQIVRDTGGDATQVRGLARDPGTGDAYAFVTFAVGTAPQLCRLDLGTGVATAIAPANPAFATLACRANGVLYGVQVASATAPASLHTIDRTTGQTTLVAALPPNSDGEALVVAADQALYRATGRGAPNVDEVFERLDPATGARTTVPLSGDDFDGAAVLGAYTGSYLLVVDHAQQLHCVTTTGRVRHFGGLDHTPTGLVFAPASNEAPFFRQYGDGCALANGDFPLLMGCGNPMGGHNPGVHLRYAVPGAIGVLAAGGDDGVVAFPSAACPMQVEPLFFTMLFTADALGDFNTWFALPVGTAPTDVFFQIGLLDGTDLRVTNGVQMHVR